MTAAQFRGTRHLTRPQTQERRRNDTSGIGTLLDEPHPCGLIGAAEIGDQLCLDIPLLLLEAQDRSIAQARGLGALDAPDQFVPTYEVWTIRREAWLPPFPFAHSYARDREG